MQKALIRNLSAALLCALAALAPPARALVLGEVEVRSRLGQPLDARVPITGVDGSTLESNCFTLSREQAPGIPLLTEGTLAVERVGDALFLRIRSTAPINEPAVSVVVQVQCPSQVSGESLRMYSVLVDPPTGYSDRASAPQVAATLNARPGDSLQSIARKVVPGNAVARSRYLAAMRELNPELAAAGDAASIADGAPVALPDLRVTAKARVVPPPRTASRKAVAATAVPAPAVSSPDPFPTPVAEGERPAPATAVLPPPVAQARSPASAATRPAAGRASPGFALKLSAAQVDLAPTRLIDDRGRAKLRERLLVLDADDQVAAVLQMQNSLKLLEARVAELQLKLAAIPPSLAARAESPSSTAPVSPPSQAPAQAAPLPRVVEPSPPAIVAAVPAPAPTPTPTPPNEAPRIDTPQVDPPKAGVTRAEDPPRATPAPASKATPRPAPGPAAGLPWLWGLVAILVALAMLLAIRVLRRRRDDVSQAPADEWIDVAGEVPVAAHDDGKDAIVAEAPLLAEDQVPESPRRSMVSDAHLTTRLLDNSDDLRRRYMEERFPEIANRTIALEDPASVVKAARLFYEDGVLPRAVELLQFAIEDKPGEVRTWLALFEIFRLERLTGEFATLAARFEKHHGETEHWHKVQFFGREIDPGNPLYKEASFNTLETIGPRESRRLAAATASFDPIAENWLNAPMDFENEVLANELRQALMGDAELAEQDLIPNPMPALRNVEMFTVA